MAWLQNVAGPVGISWPEWKLRSIDIAINAPTNPNSGATTPPVYSTGGAATHATATYATFAEAAATHATSTYATFADAAATHATATCAISADTTATHAAATNETSADAASSCGPDDATNIQR